MRKIEAAVCGITLLYVFSTIGTIYCLIMGSYLTLFLISDTVAVLCFMSYIAIRNYLLKMKPENSIRNKKVELAVSSVVFLYAANIVWYFLTGVFEWGDPLGVYLIFIANGILGLILYVAVSLICYRKIKISPKNNRVLRICLIIITGIFFVWLVLFRLLPNFE